MISIILMMSLLLVCQRWEGEDHASVLTWLTGSASLRFAPEGCLCQSRLYTKHLTCTPRTVPPRLFNNKGSWRATWMLLPKAITPKITFSQLERPRARPIIAIAFNSGCLITL